MMVNPTKRQKEIYKLYDEKVIPWVYVDQKTGQNVLKPDAPKEVKDIYELFMNS